jgi:hypothetical protein
VGDKLNGAKTIADVIASRTLSLTSEFGATRVEILIGRPQPYEGSTGYFCPVQITGLDDERVVKVGGADSYQALKLAFKIIAATIDSLDIGVRSRLRLDGESDLDI